MNLTDMIRAVQKALGIEADGAAGPDTWNAIYNRICPNARALAPTSDKVDDRSEKVIATLLPQVHPYARELVRKAAQHGITIKVISGLRTYAEKTIFTRKSERNPDRS